MQMLQWIFLIMAILPSWAFADGESLGHFSFHEFSVSPRMRVEEPKRGGFELKETWIGFEWRRDESLSALFGLGSSDLVLPAVWYTPKPQQLEFVAASVNAETPYVNFHAGLLAVPFTYEGEKPEWEWALPATRVRRQSWFTKRDFGIEFEFHSGSYLTKVFIHNGEGATNADNRLWYTGLWQYKDTEGYAALLSASTGGTGPESTLGSVAPGPALGFVFDPTQDAKIRLGSLAIFRRWLRHLVLVEVGRGETIQLDTKHPFAWGHLDLAWNLGGDLSFLFRYEQTQNDLQTTETIVKSSALGLQISSEDRLSSISLMAVKNQESPEKQNDEFLLQFRLNSNFLP